MATARSLAMLRTATRASSSRMPVRDSMMSASSVSNWTRPPPTLPQPSKPTRTGASFTPTRVCEDGPTMANPSQQLAVRLSLAIQHAFGDEFAGTDPIVRRSTQPGFDYQANVAMSLGKRVGAPPRDVAARIIDAADLSGLCSTVEVAGPGVVNLRLEDEIIVGALTDSTTDSRLGVAEVPHPDCAVVDYSSPNG